MPDSRSDIHLFDLFEPGEIQDIQDAFALATGVASLIITPDGTPLTRPSNFCELCTKIIRGTEEGRKNCHASDVWLGRFNPDGPNIGRCMSGGLWDAGASITAGRQHVATWLVGQVRDEKQDTKQMLEYADRIGVDREEFAAALDKVPLMSREQFGRVAEAMFLIASQLSGKAYQTLLQREVIRKKNDTQERLKRSEERFRTFFDSVNDAIFIHEFPSGRIVDANRRATEMFGYSYGELLELTISDLNENVESSDEDLGRALQRKVSSGKPQTLTWKARSKSGATFWVEGSLRFTRMTEGSFTVVSIRDIRARKRAEAEALKEQRFSNAVVDSVPGLLYLYDEEGRLIRWNRQHAVLTGYTDEELAGRHLLDWYRDDPETIARIEAAIGRVYEEGIAYEEAWLQTKSGEKIPFFLTAVKLEFEGRNYFTGVGIDISERIKAEEALKESEARYRSIIENIQDTYYRTDADDALIMLSPSGAALLGCDSAEDLLGRSFGDLWKSREAYAEFSGLLASHGVVKDFETTLVGRNGTEVLVENTGNVYRDASGTVLGQEGILRDIGKRRRAEQELARERMFTDAVMESMPGLLYIYDTEGRLVRWNQSHERLTGFSPEELKGRHVREWFGGREPDTSTIMASIRKAMVKGRAEAEAHLITKDGRSLPFLFTGVRHTIGGTDYLVGMGMDISQRKKAEESLRQSEEKFATLFKHSPDAIILSDLATGNLVDVNEAFSHITGYAREEALHRTTADLGFYPDESLRRRFYERLRKGEILKNEEVHVTVRSGESILCVLSAHVLTIGEDTVVMTVLRDISDFKKMQEMMIQTEKMISVGGIAAGIAHEINNPLGIIMQSAQLFMLRTRPDFPKNRDVAEKIGLDIDLLDRYMRERNLNIYVNDIREAAGRAAEIIRHMLDFSRSSESRRKVCSVHDIIDRAITLAGSDYDLRKSFDFRRVTIRREFAENLPAINCTETEIEQVMLNLLRNAAQAMGAAETAEPAITVRTALEGESIVVEIQDNGPGIPPEMSRRIFEPFFTTKPAGQGTGLGLSVSFFIVTQSHKGSMSVRSAPGQGACFRIELPLAPPGPEAT
jgi:PAS domain S-box-containing protein